MPERTDQPSTDALDPQQVALGDARQAVVLDQHLRRQQGAQAPSRIVPALSGWILEAQRLEPASDKPRGDLQVGLRLEWRREPLVWLCVGELASGQGRHREAPGSRGYGVIANVPYENPTVPLLCTLI